MRIRTCSTAAIASALLLLPGSVPPAPAQTNPDSPTGQPPARGRAFPGRERPAAAFGAPGQFLPIQRVLTEEQQISFREAMAGQRDTIRGLEQKLLQARQAMWEASTSTNFDENVVRQKALEMGKVDAELAVCRARALSQVKPPLSPEQIEQLKNPPPFPGGFGGRIGPRAGTRRPSPVLSGPRDENDLPAPPKP